MSADNYTPWFPRTGHLAFILNLFKTQVINVEIHNSCPLPVADCMIMLQLTAIKRRLNFHIFLRMSLISSQTITPTSFIPSSSAININLLVEIFNPQKIWLEMLLQYRALKQFAVLTLFT